MVSKFRYKIIYVKPIIIKPKPSKKKKMRLPILPPN